MAAHATDADDAWRRRVASLTAAYAHVCRRSLRGELALPEVTRLLGAEEADAIAKAVHMPSAVADALTETLDRGVRRGWLSPFTMLYCDEQRSLLVDHLGACERILKSPLPLVYVIKVRRFIAIYLLALPFSLIDRVGWATPIVTMLVAYPMLGLDQIAVELENPFSPAKLGHLPLDAICETIESNVLALVKARPPEPAPTPPKPSS